MSIDDKVSFQNDSLSSLSLLLSELSGQEDLFLLCRALFHEDRDVVIGAALVLGRIKDSRSVPYLLHALLTTDQKRAQALMWAIGEIGDDSATAVLLEALNANFMPENALSALGKIGSLKVVDVLILRLEDQEESIRALAAKSLGQAHFILNSQLAFRIREKVEERLNLESSRRVKLLLAVIKRKLEGHQ